MDDSSFQTAKQPIPLSYSLPAKRAYVSDWVAWPLILGVIGLIAFATVLPYRSPRSRDARIAAAQQEISAMTTALDTFQVDVGRYPTTAEGLAALSVSPPGLTSWHGPYVGKPMIKDPWENKYIYIFPGAHKVEPYDLSSAGANGIPGDSDDVTNWHNQ